jgi:ectoine hydroxylase-related dioxygenase (phytanoyl-CoA dioxygenase family)
LPIEEVTYVRERIDHLFNHWSTLPRRLAPGLSDNGAPPLLAKIHRVCDVDRAIARCTLVMSCQKIAAEILGMRHVWCRFDSAIYKHPGAGPVTWHQDSAWSTIGVPKRSVHFWIPLNDHSSDSGTLEFAPGSHRSGVAEHEIGNCYSYTGQNPPDMTGAGLAINAPLSVGNFSLHSPWIWHRSGPNVGEKVRKALTLEFSASPWPAPRQLGRPLVSVLLAPQIHGAQVARRRTRRTQSLPLGSSA